MITTAVVPRMRTSALTLLMARYIAGEIADQIWGRISAFLDAETTTAEERLAFAAYMNEWLDEQRKTTPV